MNYFSFVDYGVMIAAVDKERVRGETGRGDGEGRRRGETERGDGEGRRRGETERGDGEGRLRKRDGKGQSLASLEIQRRETAIC
jgi:hypothetical protein